eukprot:Rhum_TRINITY_DN14744_c7_g1::Rhum_TRINITY_DN14744_c7_g1_i4::g.114233::m.114233
MALPVLPAGKASEFNTAPAFDSLDASFDSTILLRTTNGGADATAGRDVASLVCEAAAETRCSDASASERALSLAARECASLRFVNATLRRECDALRATTGAAAGVAEKEAVAAAAAAAAAEAGDAAAEKLCSGAELWKRVRSQAQIPENLESIAECPENGWETFVERLATQAQKEALARRAEAAAVERKLAELDQESKELAITEKSYKLRFRGIEERELKEGDLPRRLAEVDEREQALEQREQELQDRLDAVEELRRSLLDGTVHVDPAADAADTAADDAPPAVLVVEVPNLFEMAGEFTLMAEPHVGRPQWESDDRRLYHLGGRWAIGFEHEVDEGVAWVSTTQPHRNVLPHKITSWSFAPEEGAELEVDAGIKVRCG